MLGLNFGSLRNSISSTILYTIVVIEPPGGLSVRAPNIIQSENI